MAFDLFGTQKVAMEREILQKMSQLPILKKLIKQLLGKNAEEGLTIGQSYYDNCNRAVTVEPDSFELKWSRYYQERIQVVVYEDGTPKTEIGTRKRFLLKRVTVH